MAPTSASLASFEIPKRKKPDPKMLPKQTSNSRQFAIQKCKFSVDSINQKFFLFRNLTKKNNAREAKRFFLKSSGKSCVNTENINFYLTKSNRKLTLKLVYNNNNNLEGKSIVRLIPRISPSFRRSTKSCQFFSLELLKIESTKVFPFPFLMFAFVVFWLKSYT
jgi:hypothetical protein